MNKLHIILPLGFALPLAFWAGLRQIDTHDQELTISVEMHLKFILTELENHGENGFYPSPDVARMVLNDPATSERIHRTSLFGTNDLFYRLHQSRIGSEDEILFAQVGGRVFGIRGDHEVRKVRERFTPNDQFLSLAASTDKGAQPGEEGNAY